MWDDYHRQQLAEVEDEAEDDWDDDWTKTTKKALSSFTSVNALAGWCQRLSEQQNGPASAAVL
ncbi:Uncharacterised protein [Salmonella bongori]|nr:Uncharacterised protein [Salmonella bongori]